MSDPMPADNDWTYEAARDAATALVISRITDITASMAEIGRGIGSLIGRAFVDGITRGLGAGLEISDIVPFGVQIVKPAKGYAVWYGWRDGRWAPVHRVRGVGWVWSA